MRKSIKEAIGTTIQDMLDSGFQSSFTKKELNSLGVKIPDIVITSAEIKEIRKKTNLSQAVFAKLLNVSSSSVKQWEQGKRVPTGSTKVLLELLNKSPHLLNYRIGV
ncbi:MAG: helix-turn-helix domain-containing protein [Deltaproteobacteria bacterium]|jgi:putative transcriptional regulator|nr:helix-turn-helix domain-containing protein [Deltaproteobacteria bacterium]